MFAVGVSAGEEEEAGMVRVVVAVARKTVRVIVCVEVDVRVVVGEEEAGSWAVVRRGQKRQRRIGALKMPGNCILIGSLRLRLLWRFGYLIWSGCCPVAMLVSSAEVRKIKVAVSDFR